jgi:enamine deaminase RidA (YjgF/YER057c/UK114 family)
MNKRQNISSGTPWENIVGFSRAVRIGNIVEVAGTTAVDGTELIGDGDAYKQSMFIFRKIELALQQAGAELCHVIRTRMFITTTNVMDDVLRAHGEVFRHILPAASLYVVSALIDERLMVEIEVSAVISDGHQ